MAYNASPDNKYPEYAAPYPPNAGIPPYQPNPSGPLYPPNPNMQPYQPPLGPPPPDYQSSPYAIPQPTQAAVYPPPPVVVVQPTGGYLGHNPSTAQCATCRQQVITNVRYEAGGMTWLIAFLICFFGGFVGCCLIPFCIPGCQDAIHTCPACHSTIGRKSAF